MVSRPLSAEALRAAWPRLLIDTGPSRNGEALSLRLLLGEGEQQVAMELVLSLVA